MSIDNPISIDDEVVSRGRPVDRCQTPQLSPRWMRWAEDRMNYFSQSRMATPTPLRHRGAWSYREESPVVRRPFVVGSSAINHLNNVSFSFFSSHLLSTK
jgi:hypothetical protein